MLLLLLQYNGGGGDDTDDDEEFEATYMSDSKNGKDVKQAARMM